MSIDNTQQEEMMRRLREDLLDSYDEELEMELEERNMEELEATGKPRNEAERLARRTYFQELFRLQGELVKLLR